jgi:hypothetical protein
MHSPSEPEFVRTAQDLITLEIAEQEVYADVRLRAAYTRYRMSLSHKPNMCLCPKMLADPYSTSNENKF